MIFKNVKNNQGFSLLEIIVAISLFSVIMLSAVSIFGISLNAQRNAVSAQNVQESLRYSLEAMSKEIRMAEKNDGSCSGLASGEVYSASGVELFFKNQSGECVRYYLDSSRLMISRAGNSAVITPNDVTVNSLNFSVANDKQPRVTISINAQLKINSKAVKTIRLQTTVSSRNYK